MSNPISNSSKNESQNEFDIFASGQDDRLEEMLNKGSYKWTNKFTRFALILFLIVTSASAGAWYQSKQSVSNAANSITSLRNSFRNGGGGFGGGTGVFGGGNSNGSFGNSASQNSTGSGSGITISSTAGADVAGTVISIDAKTIVIQTLDGSKKSFPITDTTKYRSSSKIDAKAVAPGDIVTVKPDDSNSAKTIMVVK